MLVNHFFSQPLLHFCIAALIATPCHPLSALSLMGQFRSDITGWIVWMSVLVEAIRTKNKWWCSRSLSPPSWASFVVTLRAPGSNSHENVCGVAKLQSSQNKIKSSKQSLRRLLLLHLFSLQSCIQSDWAALHHAEEKLKTFQHSMRN